jgi:hypothetical protein
MSAYAYRALSTRSRLAGCNGRDHGARAQYQCPAHEDRNPSLSVTDRDDRALLCCHAGCDTLAVLEALELEWADLFDERKSTKGWTIPTLRRVGARANGDGRVDLGSVRYLPGARNGERKSLAAAGATRDLWPDPAKVDGAGLFVVEGEPDAVTAAELGIRAVAVPGAKAWRPEWAQRIGAGRRSVVVIADADAPGRQAAKRWAEAIAAHCADVRLLDLAPKRQDGFDLSDFAALAETEPDRQRARELLVAAANKAPRIAPPVVLPDKRTVKLTNAAAITARRVRWMWRDWIPLRGLVVVAGEPGLGKSTFTNAHLVAKLTRGALDGELTGRPVDVLVATAEDDWEMVVKPRLMAAGADLARVHRVEVLDPKDGASLLTLPGDVRLLEDAIAGLRAQGRTVGMVVVDPIGAFLSEATDSHKDAHVRRALAPLADLAIRLDLVALAVAHLNKDASQRLLLRLSGAGAFGAAPRSVLGFARDPDDPDGEQGCERVIVHAKSNWGRYATSLAVRIESRQVDTDDGMTDVGYLRITGESTVGVEDLQGTGRRDDQAGIEEAIAAALADGPQPARAVKATVRAEAECSTRTVERAAARMERNGELSASRDGFPAVTTWRLAVATPPVATHPVSPRVATEETRIDTGSFGAPGVQLRHAAGTCRNCSGGGGMSGRPTFSLELSDDALDALADRLADRLASRAWSRAGTMPASG